VYAARSPVIDLGGGRPPGMDYRRRNYTRAGNYRIGDATRRVSAVAATQRRDAASSHPYSSFSPKSTTSSNSSDLSSPLLNQEQPQPRPPASGAPPLRQRLGGAQARPNQVPLGAQLCDAACFGTGVKWHPCGYEDPGAKAVRQSRIEDEDMRWEWAEDGGFPSGFSLPGWWIAFQQWAGFNPFWALLNDIILPLQVEKISPSGKFAQLGFVNAAQMFQAFGEAAFGVICDRTPDNRFGRRRLHVGLAAVPNLLAVLMMWYSLDPGLSETAAVYFLAGGVALQAIISTWSGAAMSAQLVECTPEHQRGVAGSWSGVFDSMENFAEQGLTVLVGWSVLTFDGTYAFSCVMFIIGPIANIVSYSRRPWFYPEPPTPRNLREGGAGREGQGGKDEGGSSSCSCLVRAWQVVKRELIGANNAPFLEPFHTKKRSFCQDRLGTSLGKVQKKRGMCFLLLQGSSSRCNTSRSYTSSSTSLSTRSILVASTSTSSRITSSPISMSLVSTYRTMRWWRWRSCSRYDRSYGSVLTSWDPSSRQRLVRELMTQAISSAGQRAAQHSALHTA
jgi:hypothetical protein